MNLLFSLLKTPKMEELEILDEEAMGFSSESSMEEYEGEDSCTEGSQSPEMLGLIESEEEEDMETVGNIA